MVLYHSTGGSGIIANLSVFKVNGQKPNEPKPCWPLSLGVVRCKLEGGGGKY